MIMPPNMAAILNQRILPHPPSRRTPEHWHRRDALLARLPVPPGTRNAPGAYSRAMHALGIDIGGSGIKGAPVDVTTGKLLADRQKIETPRPAKPDAVADVVKKLVTSFSWSGPIGITFPGVVTDGVTRTAANLDPAWIGTDAGALFGRAAGNPV